MWHRGVPMLIELHILQNVAPSCLNRDDTNAPKDCEFGGHRRARLSSQSLKRALRWHPEFAASLRAPLAVRTKRLVETLAQRLAASGYPEAIAHHVVAAVVHETIGQVGSDGRTRVLAYLGQDEIAALEQLLRAHWEQLARAAAASAAEPPAEAAGDAGADHDPARAGRGPLQKAARQVAAEFRPGTCAPDIALFGRMIAENAHLNVEAACQVAHALSTHRVAMEMDFFTAVDDLKPGRRGAAEMIGTTEFYSACFYRYSVVLLEQLVANLGGDEDLAREVVVAFLRASVAALPRGRENSTAAHSPPSFVMAVVRERGMPWSLVNAFETPIWAPDHDRQGLVARSLAALGAHWADLVGMYGADGVAAAAACWLGRMDARPLQPYRVPGLSQLVGVVTGALQGCEVPA
jgi:CRISPR system Cascade subunit CasC